MQLVKNDLGSSINQPQNILEEKKESDLDKSSLDILRKERHAEIEREKQQEELLNSLTPDGIDEKSISNAKVKGNKKQKEKQSEFQTLLKSNKLNGVNQNDETNVSQNQINNAFDDLMEEGLDSSMPKAVNGQYDKQKLKEIMAKKNGKVEEKVIEQGKADHSSLFYGNSNKQKDNNKKWDKDESEEDEFEKLIGHIEGSKSESKKEQEAVEDDVEEEDYF